MPSLTGDVVPTLVVAEIGVRRGESLGQENTLISVAGTRTLPWPPAGRQSISTADTPDG